MITRIRALKFEYLESLFIIKKLDSSKYSICEYNNTKHADTYTYTYCLFVCMFHFPLIRNKFYPGSAHGTT